MPAPLPPEAESLLAQLPQLFPDERARVRAAWVRGDDAARAAILEKLRAAREEYGRNGKTFERAAAEAFGSASAKLAGARRAAAKGARERAETAARLAEDDPGDLLSGL